MKKTVEITLYSCDNCGAELEDSNGYLYYIEEDMFEACGEGCGWIEHEGKHYCPDCYEIGDNDEIILKN